MKTIDLLVAYKVQADTTDLTLNDTSLRYFMPHDRFITCRGLVENSHAILVDTASGLERHVTDTLHDYCLFASGSGDFYKEHAADMATELRKMGLQPPSEFFLVSGKSYPGSRSYVFELNGKLIFT